MAMTHNSFLLITTTILLIFPSIQATEFIFNKFINQEQLLLYGTATILSPTLTLTNGLIGRALYFSKIPTSQNSSHILPFSSSFIFSITPYRNFIVGHGFAFIFTPNTGINVDGKSDDYVLAVEFDMFGNYEFVGINGNHVVVEAGYWGGKNDDKFNKLEFYNGENYQVWIDYKDMEINVTMAKVGLERPTRPLINTAVNLSGVLFDEMYVGFTGFTGSTWTASRILSWSFSNLNSSIGDALVTTNLPSFVVEKGSIFQSKLFILLISFGVVLVVGCVLVLYVVFVRRNRLLRKARAGIEDWEVEYWPHRIDYQEIEAATKGFAEENVIGFGGNSKVYKGELLGGREVAVKKTYECERGMREFLAEVSSLGRLKHRSLVGLIGWCKRERGSLMLVYDYLENGSLDKRVFECEQSMLLSWEERVKVLKDVANGILYLHEGWEVKVLHRDIKASNVLLDKDMNARLGDFGLARIHQHDQYSAGTTQVVGTVGYLAPEVVQTGRFTAQTDVFGFGVLVLEVVSGRRPIEEGKPGLVDWACRLMERGELIYAVDERLKAKGGYSDEELEKVLNLGLLCVTPDPQNRPTMRQVLKALEWENGDPESQGEETHPTFQDKTLPSSSPVSLSGSFIITEGR